MLKQAIDQDMQYVISAVSNVRTRSAMPSRNTTRATPTSSMLFLDYGALDPALTESNAVSGISASNAHADMQVMAH